jgi:eukaryotic-like serine/threonine-protein kinase
VPLPTILTPLPDAWMTFNLQSQLGGALLGQKKYVDAEPLLLAGYEGMKKQAAKIPPPGKVRLTEAVERLVQLYEATGKKDEAAKWRKELEASKAAQKKREK